MNTKFEVAICKWPSLWLIAVEFGKYLDLRRPSTYPFYFFSFFLVLSSRIIQFLGGYKINRMIQWFFTPYGSELVYLLSFV